MVDEIGFAQRGDLVEILLEANAKKIEEARTIFVPDCTGETNIPGRSYAGYVSKVEPDSIFLAHCWDKINHRIPDNAGAIEFYLDAIKIYYRLE